MILLWLLAFSSLHPIHISVTEIEHNANNRSLEITSRIFIDDLEISVRSRTGKETLDLLNPGSGFTTDQLVKEYLGEHLRIKVDGKPARLNYLAHEIDDAALVCYLEIEGVKRLKNVDVMNSVIQETHYDQSNLVHVTYLGTIKSLRLTRERPNGTLEFDKPNP